MERCRLRDRENGSCTTNSYKYLIVNVMVEIKKYFRSVFICIRLFAGELCFKLQLFTMV